MTANTNPAFSQHLLPLLAAEDELRHPKWLSCLKFCGTARNPYVLQARVAKTLQLAARARILPPHYQPTFHFAPGETSAGVNCKTQAQRVHGTLPIRGTLLPTIINITDATGAGRDRQHKLTLFAALKSLADRSR